MTQYSDDMLKTVLTRTKVVALVGFSNNPDRPSHKVARYLAEHGYRVIAVNPGLAGQDFLGEPVVADLASIPDDAEVDMLDIFRRSEAVGPVVEAALATLPALKTVWMQLGVTNPQAQAMAEANGLEVIQDRCPKIEHERLIA